MEIFGILVLVIIILGMFAYITRPTNSCHHSWETSTPVDNDDIVIHEHICNKCGKIDQSNYFKKPSS